MLETHQKVKTHSSNSKSIQDEEMFVPESMSGASTPRGIGAKSR